MGHYWEVVILGKFVDISGLKIGGWTISSEFKKVRTSIHWKCKCECGIEKFVLGSSITSGKSNSCGCLNRKNKRHGLSKTTEYYSWNAMMSRCYNEKNIGYNLYGGKGITVCEEWHSFENFLRDMGKKPDKEYTIDRIDGEKNYSKENCRWATKTQQTRNRKIDIKNEFNCPGVSKNHNSFQATIGIGKETKYLGCFKNVEDAIKARKEAELKYWGEPS